jgi:hypothetical protein
MTTEFNMRTSAVTVSKEANVGPVCAKLIAASQWFSVTPLPDDRWEIAVKAENDDLLHACIREIEKVNPDQP